MRSLSVIKALFLKVVFQVFYHSQFQKSHEDLERTDPLSQVLLTWASCVHQENIHKTRVVTLSKEELGTMSENNLRGTPLGIKPLWQINSLTLHLFLPE